MTRPSRSAVLFAVVSVLIAGCSPAEKSFRGTFVGHSMGQPCSVELTPEDGKVTGLASIGQVSCSFSGTLEGDRLTGTASQPTLGIQVRIEAKLEGDTLHWTAHMYDPMTGTTSPVSVDLARAGTKVAEPPAGGGSLDPRIIGNWRRTIDTTVNAGVRENLNMATDVFCTLGPDGSYRFGGAQSAFAAESRLGSAGGETGPAATTTGKWKTENQVLYAMPQGGAWTPVGRYSVSGSGLVLYPQSGQAQYWER